jgi:hypothetical protein
MKSLIALSFALPLLAQPPVSLSAYLKADEKLNLDPGSKLWKTAPVTVMEKTPPGAAAPAALKTEVRSRWSGKYLYFLFTCPYEKLTLKPDTDAKNETNKLWEWDVVEIFVGAEFDNITRYREYQVSPRAEWVDLDIDRKTPLPEGGWKWDSKFEVAARIDAAKKIWYGAMKTPMASINGAEAKAGKEMRINYYRLDGVAPSRTSITWNPTASRGHHVPEKFGLLRLEK